MFLLLSCILYVENFSNKYYKNIFLTEKKRLPKIEIINSYKNGAMLKIVETYCVTSTVSNEVTEDVATR